MSCPLNRSDREDELRRLIKQQDGDDRRQKIRPRARETCATDLGKDDKGHRLLARAVKLSGGTRGGQYPYQLLADQYRRHAAFAKAEPPPRHMVLIGLTPTWTKDITQYQPQRGDGEHVVCPGCGDSDLTAYGDRQVDLVEQVCLVCSASSKLPTRWPMREGKRWKKPGKGKTPAKASAGEKQPAKAPRKKKKSKAPATRQPGYRHPRRGESR